MSNLKATEYKKFEDIKYVRKRRKRVLECKRTGWCNLIILNGETLKSH